MAKASASLGNRLSRRTSRVGSLLDILASGKVPLQSFLHPILNVCSMSPAPVTQAHPKTSNSNDTPASAFRILREGRPGQGMRCCLRSEELDNTAATFCSRDREPGLSSIRDPVNAASICRDQPFRMAAAQMIDSIAPEAPRSGQSLLH